MANLVIPPWRGQVYPPQLPPLQYYNSGATFYQQPPPTFYQHPSANTLYQNPGATFYQQPTTNNIPFNPGPMRNPQATESDDLDPLEPQAPLSPQNTGSQNGAPPARRPTVKTTNPIEPKKALPIHFLEREPEMPKYTGGRKTVKIKPLDKELIFDGSNMPIEKFIKRYEAAGNTDGASPQDLANQIIPFIKGMDLKDEVEEMSGYEDSNWEKLKKQLLNRFGSSLPLVKYTSHDLKHLVSSAIRGGGIRTLEHFKIFRTKFEAITHYLVRMGYSSNLEESTECLLEALSPDLESSVTKELIRDNMMLASKDGGDILPDTETLISYIHREVQSASVMERRKILRNMEPVKTDKPQTQKTPDQIAMEGLTKTLSSWHAQKAETPKSDPLVSKSHVPYKPAQLEKDYSTIKCNYCLGVGHTFYRCNLANEDEMKGLFKKDGPNVILPDGTQVQWNKFKAFKTAVDQYHQSQKQPGIINIPPRTLDKPSEPQTSYGKLEEIDDEEDDLSYECEAAKRTRSGNEYPEEVTVSKKVRKEKEDLMDIDKDRLLEIARQDDYNPVELPASSTKEYTPPNKKVQFQKPVEKQPSPPKEPPKEKSPKKTYVERPLTNQFPDAEDKVVSRMLMDGRMELSLGEIFAISNGAVEAFKKKISPKRIPLEPTKSTNSGGIDQEAEDDDSPNEEPSHYACPLGYIDVSINGKPFQALLDNGSQVNLLPRDLAARMGLIITQRAMNLKGIGGHKNEILGEKYNQFWENHGS
ncbi:uncharacterized protein PGTG_22014 [Puccinia graminis f. sp. tritici CRL 75-36-700-3]|uniref:Peptidase A2 domain-containing protein n=1 Tax=Puccinia graminis f. sp. tritici (strain CRL 75-36-700-3 / race SCCL) TaxID=418459 RepID=H6QT65_PUCGT|nr:uncharacterized protein PGTG_22014 [Puccinia graminis f. sp. tritici CRL 75-36-700-3]EHS64016.1 hypothetical protein PGTG_22014 [Puccinia graminis f. sp. tritici CRL 75-36-700-3]